MIEVSSAGEIAIARMAHGKANALSTEFCHTLTARLEQLSSSSARAVVVIDAEGRIRHNKVQPLSLFRPKDDDVLAAIRAAQGTTRTDA